MFGIIVILVQCYMYAFLGYGIFPDDKRLSAMALAMLIELFVEVITVYAYYVYKES
jgi:hypothetical protein